MSGDLDFRPATPPVAAVAAHAGSSGRPERASCMNSGEGISGSTSGCRSDSTTTGTSNGGAGGGDRSGRGGPLIDDDEDEGERLAAEMEAEFAGLEEQNVEEELVENKNDKVEQALPQPSEQKHQNDALVLFAEDIQALQARLQESLASLVGAEMRRVGATIRDDVRTELKTNQHRARPETALSVSDPPVAALDPFAATVCSVRSSASGSGGRPRRLRAPSAVPPPRSSIDIPSEDLLPGMIEMSIDGEAYHAEAKDEKSSHDEHDEGLAKKGSRIPRGPDSTLAVVVSGDDEFEESDGDIDLPPPSSTPADAAGRRISFFGGRGESRPSVGGCSVRRSRPSLIEQNPQDALHQATERFRERQLKRMSQRVDGGQAESGKHRQRKPPRKAMMEHHGPDAYISTTKVDGEDWFKALRSGGGDGGAIPVVPSAQTLNSLCQHLVISDKFDYCMCVMLLVNALFIGLEVNWQASNHNSDEPWSSSSLSSSLSSSSCACRNMFDLFLVLTTWLEEVITAIVGSGAEVAERLQIIRMVRVLRLLRIIRVLRLVRFVSELRKLLYLIAASFWSFVWTALLLVLLTYIIGVFFTQVVVDQLSLNPSDTSPDTERLGFYFSDTWASMFSLYKSITGGVDWGDIQSPLSRQISPVMGMIFALYVAFAVLVLLNLVTGVFVDGAMRLTKEDKQAELLKKVRKAFGQVDSDSTGDITWSEFTEHFLSPEMHEVFKAIEISMARAEDLFHFLDQDGSGALSAEEFAVGAINLQGPAKAIDLAMFSVQTHDILNRIEALLVSHTGIDRLDRRSIPEGPEDSHSDDGDDGPLDNRMSLFGTPGQSMTPLEALGASESLGVGNTFASQAMEGARRA